MGGGELSVYKKKENYKPTKSFSQSFLPNVINVSCLYLENNYEIKKNAKHRKKKIKE